MKVMDTKYVEEYMKQFTDWQKKFFETWTEAMPNMAEGLKMPETVEKGLEMQEEMVKNYLEAQETATKLALESQKKFWDNYFELARKNPMVKPA
jgi:polyhydroxyalkanoate synthesis regulator protein